MNYKNKHKKVKIILGIFGLIIIPIFSIAYALEGDLKLMTFSQIAGRYHLRQYLVVWGLLLAIFIFLGFNYIFILTEMKNNFVRTALTMVCTMLLISVFVPFIPSMFPLIANIHNYMSYATVVFSIVFLYSFVLTLQKTDKRLYKLTMILLNIMILSMIIFYLFVGTSSLFQIEYSFVVSFFLFILLVFIEKSEVIDIEKVLGEKTSIKNLEFLEKKLNNLKEIEDNEREEPHTIIEHKE